MRPRLTLLSAAIAVPAICAAEVYNAESGTFDLDARANSFSVDTAAEVSEMLPVTFGANNSGKVTLTDPNSGASRTYTYAQWNAAFSSGKFNPPGGGTWALSIDNAPSWERTAQFVVKYAACRTVENGRPRHYGAGGDPEILYYAGEMAEYGADGFVFTLADGVAMPSLPAGLSLLDMGQGVYMLYSASTSPQTYSGYAVDTRQDSTNRIVRTAGELVPIAYTVDGWAYTNTSQAATLKYRAPGAGSDTSAPISTGTGGYNLALGENVGLWRVTMTAGGESEYASILYKPYPNADISASYNNLTNVVVGISGAMPNTTSTVKVQTVDGTVVASATISEASCDVTPQLAALVAGLDPGVMYQIVVEDEYTAESAGEFMNGVGVVTNFYAKATGAGAEEKSGGDWASGLAPTAITGEGYAINGTARFNVTAERPDGGYYCVDAVVKYSSFASNEDIMDFASDDCFAGIVAVTNGTTRHWAALSSSGEWVPLAGRESAIAPELCEEYTVRAEFDFSLSPRRVRYSVKQGGDFAVLTNGSGSAWLEAAGASNKISAVSFTGASGTVAMFEGHLVDTNAVVGAGGGRLGLPTTGGGNYTLRTNLEGWKPSDAGSKTYNITHNGHFLHVPTSDGDGVKVVLDGTKYSVETAYYEATNVTRNAKYTWLTNAVKKVANANENVKALKDAEVGVRLETPGDKGVYLNLDGHTISGSGSMQGPSSGSGSLIITNGYYAVSGDVSKRVALRGGVKVTADAYSKLRANNTHGFSSLGGKASSLVHQDGGKIWAVLPLLTGEGEYAYRSMNIGAGSTVAATNKLEACLVKEGDVNKGYIAISNNWPGLTTKTAAFANAAGDNGLPRWQSYVMGLDPSKAGDKPYLVPVQVDGGAQLQFGLGTKSKSPANSSTTIEYIAPSVAAPGAVPAGTPDQGQASNITSNLDSSAVQYYRPKIRLTPDPLISGE